MRTISNTTTKIFLSMQDKQKLQEELKWTFIFETEYGEMVFKTETEYERVYITHSDVRKYEQDRLQPISNDEIVVLAEIFKQEGNAN